MTNPVIGLKASSGETQDVTSGKAVEKIGVAISTTWNGGGRSGRFTLRPTSIEREMFASTSARGPILARLSIRVFE